MSNSSGYNGVMRGLSTVSSEALEEEVSKHRYQTAVGYKENEPFFRLCFVSKEDEGSVAVSRSSAPFVTPTQWWTPIHDATRLAILGTIFAAIVLVELLHQRSKKNNGLADIDDSSHLRYAWQMIPALIAVILFSLVGLMDYATRIIQPYHVLKRGTAPANRSIQINYLSSLAPGAVLKALRFRHFGVVFSAGAILLAPLLTIVASGLYFPQTSQGDLSENFQVVSNLDPNTSNSSASFPAAANAVLSASSASWPQWTRDNLVFPVLAASSSTHDVVNSTSSQLLNAHVPAMFATLNCTAVPVASVKVWTTSTNSSSNSTSRLSPHVAIPMDAGCGAPCMNTTDINTCTGGSYIYTTIDKPPAGAYLGSLLSSKSIPTPAGWNDSCPQLSVMYGKSAGNGSQIDDLVVMNCYPAIMQADTTATFSMPDGDVTTANANTKTAQRMVFGEKATVNMNTILTIAANANDPTLFDPTFAALTSARDAVPLTQLVGQDNIQRVTDALETLYGRVMAQHLNLESRVTTTSKKKRATTSINGDITATTSRLIQDTISTRILEGLLGAIFLFLALSCVFADTRKVLPYNPCSIARMSSLIAGSELTNGVVPAGTEWCGDRAIKKSGFFDVYVFSLGLWEKQRGHRGTERLFGIDTGKAEKLE